jgi:probable HAF family extracellular repeat protein
MTRFALRESAIVANSSAKFVEARMKSGRTLTLMTAIFFTLMLSLWLSAQNTPASPTAAQNIRYRLIDLGTLGGPNSSEGSTVPLFNNQGVVTGGSDILLIDPNCVFPPNCLDLHAFRWDSGTLIDLGTLPGGNNSLANAINGHGQIAGLSENGVFDSFLDSPVTRPVLWENGLVIDLGDFGGPNGFANSINNRGQVVGAVQTDIPDPVVGTQFRPFLWQKGVLRNLGTLGGPYAEAGFVNQGGQVVGFSFVSLTPFECADPPFSDFPLITHAFLWESGTMQDIGTLGGTCSFDRALNNRGQVAGHSTLAGDQIVHPFLWDHGTMTDLGTLGGSTAHVFAMNDAGDAGNSALPGDAGRHAVLWRNGMIIDLGTVGDDPCSDAHGINIRGQVVGSSHDCVEEEHGFLWQLGGPMIDLNAFVPPDSDLTITDGQTINDRGEIAASGMLPNGNFHAILLVPCGSNPPDSDGCRDATAPMAVHNNNQVRPTPHKSPTNRFMRRPFGKLPGNPLVRTLPGLSR